MSYFLFKYFRNRRLVRQQIEDIIEIEFNGYRGSKYGPIKLVHNTLRSEIGNDSFLQFLKEATQKCPKPIYKSSIEI